MSGTSTLTQFQRFVWESMPIRKEAVGQEVVYDIVTVAIQLWPTEHLSQAEDKQIDIVLSSLVSDIRRILSCVYSEERFDGFWILGAKALTPRIVNLIYDWWKRRKDNQAKVAHWRRRWVIE